MEEGKQGGAAHSFTGGFEKELQCQPLKKGLTNLRVHGLISYGLSHNHPLTHTEKTAKWLHQKEEAREVSTAGNTLFRMEEDNRITKEQRFLQVLSCTFTCALT